MALAMHIARHYFGITDPNNYDCVREKAAEFLISELSMHGPAPEVRSMRLWFNYLILKIL